MKLTKDNLRKLIKEEIRTGYAGRMGRFNLWHDYTDWYNNSYRRFHNTDAFALVEYNDPLNIVLAYPLPGRFQYDTPFAMFGITRARGLEEDLKYLQTRHLGTNSKKLTDDDWAMFHEDPMLAIQEVNPLYLKNFQMQDPTADMTPRDELDDLYRRMFPAILG